MNPPVILRWKKGKGSTAGPGAGKGGKMYYRCDNCGGNVIYDPGKRKMICESCHSEGSQKVILQDKMEICDNCGGALDLKPHTLSCKCPYCDTYLVLKERMEGKLAPDLVLPFCIDKHKAAERIKENFGSKLFLPKDFCSVSSIEKMEGLYAPFWMYDINTHVDFEGEGDKIRTWTDGDYQYTETKTFAIQREFCADYHKIPVDASVVLEDDLMDILEPYHYDELLDFVPEYLSGFFADVYDEDKDLLKPRADQKAERYSRQYLEEMNAQYSHVRTFRNKMEHREEKAYYAFLPVWRYIYRFHQKNYVFYVNGQTGKVIGAPPISRKRAVGLSALLFLSLFFCLEMLVILLGVI